jgi:hypothetical protein
MQRGPNIGKRCPNQIVGGNKNCNSCLNKSSIKKLLEKKKISPTLTKLKEKIDKDMENFEVIEQDISNEEFQDIDLYKVLFDKAEEKIIDSKSDLILNSISSHWKFILETITMRKELSEHLVKVLLWTSNNRIIRGKNKKYWSSENDYWVEVTKESAIVIINNLKLETIRNCIFMVSSLEEKYPNNSKLRNDIKIIIDKLKNSMSIRIKKDTLNDFISYIIDNNFFGCINPLGQTFLDETFEFTKDNNFYGITSKKIYDLREDWIRRNPSTEITSYKENEIGVFGKMIKEYKTWETEYGKITKHLGIKLKNDKRK